MKKFIATQNDTGRTLIKFVNKVFPGIPKSRMQRAFRQKDIKINGKRINDKKYQIKSGDIIIVYGLVSEKTVSTTPVKADINFTKIYEDDHILIVDKKPGVAVHDEQNSLDKQVLAYLKFVQKDSFIPSHVGRIDKRTSGIMVYGKTYEAVKMLNDKASSQKKVYEFKSDLAKDIVTKFKISHDEDYQREKCGAVGKDTETIFWLEEGKKYAELVTGRKHQIRSSLSKLGVPIYGDMKYGGKKAVRLFLHATYIKFSGLSGSLKYLNGQEFRSRPQW